MDTGWNRNLMELNMKIEMSFYNPTLDTTKYAVDVYVDGKREYCGSGGKSIPECLKEVNHFVEKAALGAYVGKYAKNVETGWIGKVICVEDDLSLRLRGLNTLTLIVHGGTLEENLDEDDTRFLFPDDAIFLESNEVLK